MTPLDTTIPEPSLVVLIGPAGAGKSTIAATWKPTQVLELDHFRALVSDDPGDQAATRDAVFALQAVLESRLTRKLTTVIDATNTTHQARAQLLAAARRHGVPTVALLVSTPLKVCLERQTSRPDNRRVPEPVVRAQHADMTEARPLLADAEGFDHVISIDQVYRLKPLLRRASDTQRAERRMDTGDGHDVLLREFFGPEIAALFRWKNGSQIADGDRVGEIRLGADRLTLALRTDVPGLPDVEFEALVPCPYDDECPGMAWAPACSAAALLRALTGDVDQDVIRCTLHSPHDEDQVDDPEGQYERYEQYAEAERP